MNFVLPALYCPFPATINPHADTVDQGSLAWAQRLGLITEESAYRKFRAAHFGWLAAYLSPHSSYHGLQLLSDWNTWAIIWDDCCDRLSQATHLEHITAFHTSFLSILAGNEPNSREGPMAHSLADLRRRLVQWASPMQMQNFIHTVKGYFAGCAWEINNRAYKIIPDLAAYRQIRRESLGMDTSLALIEMIESIDLPLDIRFHPTLQRLHMLAVDSIICANDLISLEKELPSGEMHNLVMLLQHTEQLSLQEAIDRVAAMHDADVYAFLEAEQSLTALDEMAGASLEQYMIILHAFMHGNITWSSMSGRYRPSEQAMGSKQSISQHIPQFPPA
ncbi:MAG: hypothetical protein MI924_15865 [Chloroflexales bacterium]|nr:hypothetical protein [Chloroflexales bacterium]